MDNFSKEFPSRYNIKKNKEMVEIDDFEVPASFSAGAPHPRYFGTYPRVYFINKNFYIYHSSKESSNNSLKKSG